MTADNDKKVRRALRLQNMDTQSRYYGGFPDGDTLFDVKYTIHLLASMTAAYSNENSVYYHDEQMADRVLAGLDFVESLRRKTERATGVRCIPVWHKGRGVDYWKRMCAEYSYVAIGGLVFHVKKSEWPLIHKMVDYAYSKGVKVHGLGFTKTKELKNWNFYSVDSASWIKAAALGQQRHTFNGRYLETRRIDGNGKKVKLSELVYQNGIEWCKFQKYMDSLRSI